MPSNRVHVDQVETTICVLSVGDGGLLEEKHGEVDVGGKVDVDREVETLDTQLVHSLALADGVVVDKYVHRSMLLDNLLPN